MTTTYSELPPPDVTVIVETVTQTPTVTPAVLPAVVVGPCYEIVEVLNTNGSTNENARVTLPASIKSQEVSLTGALGITGEADHTIAVNNGPSYTVKFSEVSTPDTPAEVVSYFNNTLQVPGLRAVLLPGSVGNGFILLETTTTGSGKRIELEGVASSTTAILGGEYHDVDKEGSDYYEQWYIDFTTRDYPNPNSRDVDELQYDTSAIEVWMDLGATLRQVSDESAVERYGTAQMEFVDDGDGDGVSPILRIYEIGTGTGATAQPDSNAGVPISCANLNSTETVCEITAPTAAADPLTLDGTLRLSIDGSQMQDIELASGATFGDVIIEINKYFSHAAASSSTGPTGALALTSYLKGSEGTVYVDPASTSGILNDLKFRSLTGYNFGTWFPVVKQDELYINGELYGTVAKVFSRIIGAPTHTEVKLDTEWPESTFVLPATQRFYFESKNLTEKLPDSANTEPSTELYLDADGDIHIKHNLLRDTYGVPMFPGQAEMYLGYKALRVDVSADADVPQLVEISSDDDITANLGEIRTDNPLAFAAWLTRNLGCPDSVMYALGIGATSSDLPEGTLTAWTAAFSYLENWDVYTLAPLTQERTVHDLGKVHTLSMSASENKGERLYFGTIVRPTRAPDVVALSGTNGNTTGLTNEFNTNRPGITQALLDLGVDITKLDPGVYSDAEEVFLDIETDALNYRIQSISGQLITILPAAASPSWNDDGFYSTTDLTDPLITEAFSIKVRGAELEDAGGNPDKQAMSRAIADICSGYGSKRVFIGYPQDATISDANGLEQLLPSYYLAAITAGQIAQQAPQQPFTYMRVPGVLAVRGSSDFFNKSQLNVMAGGGCWIWFQETPSSAVEVRHQLSTDTSTKLNRELSLTKAIDYASKFVRKNCRPLVGRFNITEELKDMLTSVVDGCCVYLVEELKVFVKCEFSYLEVVDVDEIDVILDVTPKWPLNKITIRIRI